MARICREGARVTTNMFVRDMDLRTFDRFDGRRLEVVADGLPLFGGAQLAIDATLVSAIKRDGTARAGPGTGQHSVLQGNARSERTRSCQGKMEDVSWLFWLAKWQDGGLPRLASSLSRAKARNAPEVLRKSAETARFLCSAGGC